MAVERCYRIGDTPIVVHCETEAISTAVDTLLTHHSCRRPSALPGDVVEVGLCQAREARADRLYPPGVPLFQYDVACGYCQGSGLLVSDGYSSLAVHPERGVQGSVAPRSLEDGYLFAVITFNLALQLALRERGLYYVHAAALAGTAGTLLLVGPAGAGKTTLALALLDAGWHLISDDAVFLRRAVGAPEVVAFRRALHLSARTRGLFPSLGRRAQGPFRRSRLVWDLDPRQAFGAKLRSRGGEPMFLVLLEADGSRVSAVEPIGGARALDGLLRQSALVLVGGAAAQEHLDALAMAARSGANYQLRRGNDAYLNTQILVQLIETALAGNC